MDVQLIRCGHASDLQGVFIIPVYMAKGLEFDAVIICDADSQNYYDEDDRSLLYVACTRALPNQVRRTQMSLMLEAMQRCLANRA